MFSLAERIVGRITRKDGYPSGDWQVVATYVQDLKANYVDDCYSVLLDDLQVCFQAGLGSLNVSPRYVSEC